jgi:putative ABC transport system substrate-binding protein
MTLERRDFITLLGGAAAWPIVARAQKQDRVRRIELVQGGTGEAEEYVRAFEQEIARLRWTIGRDISITHQFLRGDGNRVGASMEEIVGAMPDVIVASTQACCRV